MKKNNKYIIIALLLGILILVNYLSNQFFLRLDLTEDKRFTLSDATKDLLASLEEPVTVTAYFSGNLPPQLEQIKRDFGDMLTEYSNRSKGMVEFEFVDPLQDDKLKTQAAQAGIAQTQVQVEEKDQVKAQIAFMGANIQMGEESEPIPNIYSTVGLEYKLSSAIKKLSITDKPVVGFVQGHGEANFGELWQAKQALDVLHSTELVNLGDSLLDLNRYNTLAIIRPKDSIPPEELSKLDAFLARGGRLFIAIDRSDADLSSEQFSRAINTGLENWLAQKGIEVNSNVVIDLNCQQGWIQPQPGYLMQITVPYYIIARNFGDHPISSSLEQLFLNFASSINHSGDSSFVVTPLVLSSEYSGTKPAEGYINITQQWKKPDFPLSDLTLAAAFEGSIGGSAPTKMVLIGDGGFPVADNQQNQVNPDNVNFLVNSIDWLSDDTGLVELRTRGATARPLDDLEDSKRAFLKYLNFLLPVVLALLYGIFRFQRNRMIRIKRMEEGYVQ
ncbi:MAG: Gldg family protein [Bacteroidales bacterium]|jgi:gliding-associated putative ABC transporter substrate-binding component GldG